MLQRLKAMTEKHQTILDATQYLLAGTTYIVPTSHRYHDIMTESLFALSKLISSTTSYTTHRSYEQLSDPENITHFCMLSFTQFEVLCEKISQISGGNILCATIICILEILKAVVRLHCLYRCAGHNMFVAWGTSPPQCLYNIDDYILCCRKWVKEHLPPFPSRPVDRWSIRFISLSSVSSSAFRSSPSTDSLDGLSVAHKANMSKTTKTVRWKDGSKDMTGPVDSNESAEAQPSPPSDPSSTASTAGTPPVALSSALKFQTSFEALDLASASAPYYPNSKLGANRTSNCTEEYDNDDNATFLFDNEDDEKYCVSDERHLSSDMDMHLGHQNYIMKKKIIRRRRCWDPNSWSGPERLRGSATRMSSNPHGELQLPVVATVGTFTIDAGQLFMLGEILYVLRPAIYATMRCRHYQRNGAATDSSSTTSSSEPEPTADRATRAAYMFAVSSSDSADPLSLLWKWLAGKDQADLLFAVVVSLVVEVVSIFCTMKALKLIRESVVIEVHRSHTKECLTQAKQWRQFERWVAPLTTYPNERVPIAAFADSFSSIEQVKQSESSLLREISELSTSTRGSGTTGTVDSTGMYCHASTAASTDITEEMMIESCGRMAAHPMDNEVRRRKLMLLLYLLRCPVFDRMTMPLLSRVCRSLSSIPLVRNLPHSLLNILQYLNKTYFYTSNSS